MGHANFETDSERLQKALMHMQCALQLLDDAGASADVGAHLDLAICRLSEDSRVSTAQLDQVPARPSN